MANKELKNLVKNYILENYKNIKENDDDQEKASIVGIKKLLDSTQERLTTMLRNITQPQNKLAVLDDVVNYVLNGFNTREDLPDATLRNHFIDIFGGGSDVENNNDIEEPSVDEEPIDEMSTSAGAGAYLSKYAYKRKK